MCSARASNTQKWRNWQTRRLQVPVVAISCGFKSHLLHYKMKQTRFRMEAGLLCLFMIYLPEAGISLFQSVQIDQLVVNVWSELPHQRIPFDNGRVIFALCQQIVIVSIKMIQVAIAAADKISFLIDR